MRIGEPTRKYGAGAWLVPVERQWHLLGVLESGCCEVGAWKEAGIQ